MQNHNKKLNSPKTSNVHGFDSKGNVTKINTKDTSHKPNTKTSVKKNASSTIVITKKPQTIAVNIKSTSTENILGGSSSKTGDYSDVRNHWLNKFDSNNKKRPADELSQMERKIPKRETAACPVCNIQQELTLMDEHLDECLERYSAEPQEECVSCGRFFAKSELENHVMKCLSDCFEKNASYSKVQERECTLCHEVLCGDAYDIHAEKCLHKLYDDVESRLKEKSISSGDVITIEDNNDSIRHEFESSCSDDESVKKYNCPFCFEMFLEDEMCDHLGKCVKDHVDKEEELNKNVSTADF